MSGERTEQPTERRLQKAREKGQFAVSKELVGALQFLVIVLIVSRCIEGWFESCELGFRRFLLPAFRPEWKTADMIELGRALITSTFLPIAASAGIVMGLTLALQLASTNMG